MEWKEILRHVDLTLLAQDATWGEIQEVCDDAVRYQTAAVCIPPSYVKRVKNYLDACGADVAVCTVIGFPNGYSTTETKVYEAKNAILNGANEIDTMMDIGWMKDGKIEELNKEMRALRDVCGNRILKVIAETCFLTEEEKINLCGLVTRNHIDFIKTSTGFGPAGAKFEDVVLFKEHLGPGVKIKAAGGISSFKDAERFLQLGASRLGTGRMAGIAEQPV